MKNLAEAVAVRRPDSVNEFMIDALRRLQQTRQTKGMEYVSFDFLSSTDIQAEPVAESRVTYFNSDREKA